MKEIIAKIDEHIEVLNEKLKKATDYFNNIVQAMEKMASDKIQVLSESNFINGSIQAYKNISDELKKLVGVAPQEEKPKEESEDKSNG